jgi:putative ABC transport system substrate-binding protein
LRRGRNSAVPVIGFVHSASDTVPDSLRGFRQGLKETGYVAGENMAIVYRWAENQLDRLPELLAELVRRQVAVFVTAGNASALAAKATTTTPIIFIVNEDPVRLGLVASVARPGGSLTGVNFFAGELVAKRGWSSCVSWCPRPLVLRCLSTRPMLRLRSPR